MVVVSEMERDGFIDRFTWRCKVACQRRDADATSLSRDMWMEGGMLLLTDWIKWSRCIGNVILLILVGREGPLAKCFLELFLNLSLSVTNSRDDGRGGGGR